MRSVVGVGLLGCGTVGTSVAERLISHEDDIAQRAGVSFDLRAVAIRDATKLRPAVLDNVRFTANVRDVVEDPTIDVVIECIGGTSIAAAAIEEALDRGKHVVTANKDAIATQGPRLCALAAARGVALRYEAAAGGAIPIVRALSESLAGDEVYAIAGVVNGTCTAILSAMEDGASYAEALAQAQQLGYAEADPSGDVGGADAANKLALLLQLGFREAVVSGRIPCVGIESIGKPEIARARMWGYRVRSIAAAVRTSDGILAQVAPMLIPQDHPFAQTCGPQNVICIIARDAGTLLMSGAGAGAVPTASAILGDVVDVMRGIVGRHDLRVRCNALASSTINEFGDRFELHDELTHLRIWNDENWKSRSPIRTETGDRRPSAVRHA